MTDAVVHSFQKCAQKLLLSSNLQLFSYSLKCLFRPLFYRVGQKNRTCLRIDNSAMVSGKKACDTSKVSECCRESTTNFHNKA